MLERQDQWKSIKSSIQKLIDLASHAGPSPEIDEAEFVRIVERQTANAEALQLQLRKIEAEDASLAARLGECTARLEFVKRPSEIKRRLSSVPNHASLENSQSVYIAHAGEDKSKLLHLLTQLIRHNFTLWIDNPEALSSEWYRANRARIIRIEPGANWRIAIMDALRRADRVLAIWSEHSIEPGRDVFMFEVDQGRVLRKCVQIKIDNTSIDKIPPPFNHDQIFDLSNISDLDAHPGLDDVVRELKVGHVRSG